MKKIKSNSKVKAYKSLFIHKPDIPPARFGKSIYIQQKHHERISRIVHIIGKSEISLYEYVNNVLEEHFKTYKEDIIISLIGQKIY